MTRTTRMTLLILALGGPGMLAAQRGAFPHAKHADAFTNCLDCHAGIPEGNAAKAFPPAADCAVCHDGQAQKKVSWTPEAKRAGGLVVFSHPRHAKGAGKEVTCETCHAERVGAPAMNVARATPERCLSCHQHKARAHQADDNKCATCHRPGRARVHATGFARDHGATAASEAKTCSDCHAQRFCTDCHVGERSGRRYHPSNFVSRHAPEAFSRDVQCSACHTTEAFCRDCHVQTGRAARIGQMTTRYHNAQPLWLVKHGPAARQDLMTCTTCHQQTYCMQCHSGFGMRVSPHGSDFDAARMASRNPRICLACHLKNPLGK